MPILAAEHDLAHPVEGDPAWSESYYFNAFDPVTDSGLFTRIGIRPNEGTIDVGLSVWLPGGGLATYTHVRPQREMLDSELEVGGVRYRMLEPMASWRLTGAFGGGDHQIELDITFEALAPAIGVDAAARRRRGPSEETARSIGTGHLEQAGRWRGWLGVDGERLEWAEARGNRDKSWGPRRWHAPPMWRWFSGNLGDDLHFGGIRVATGAGELHRGWLWDRGDPRSVREWKLSTELAEDGLSHKALELRLLDKEGRTYELRGEVMRVARIEHPGSDRGTVLNEGLTRWTLGDRTGYGISEYLHQVDARGRPVVPIE